ncbi:MAG TPA: FecR family protein [Burkholderiales bacterium]|nr:FecR family protein [Burkholderiales bacterium]
MDFAVGNVTAVNAGGQSRTLAKGAQLSEGETVSTNNGRAQLRFTDGAYVSLQPESQFRIDQYRFEGKVDGSEKGLFSLLKGGLRTVTGLVGRTNRKNYQVTTTVATIGIRGTEYTIQYGQSVAGTVGEGEIEVCNGAGCLSVTDGESYYVQNQEIKPVLSNKKTDLPPPSPQNPPPTFAEGEHVTETGDPCALFPDQCQTSSGVLTGTFRGSITLAHTTLTSGAGNQAGASSPYMGNATLDPTGRLELMEDCCGGTVGPGTTSFAEFKNDGIMTWARLTGGTLSGTASGRGDTHAGGIYSPPESFHYIIGAPVISRPIGVVNFSFLGGTAPTFGPAGTGSASGSAIFALGTLTGASMTADFGQNSIAFTLALKDPSGLPIEFTSGTGRISSGTALFSSDVPSTSISTSGSGACSGVCTVNINGFFAGANAERAGFSYAVDGVSFSCGTPPCNAVGVVGLKR